MFKSTFDANFDVNGSVNIGVGRNVITTGGKYDFQSGAFALVLFPWRHFLGKNSVVPVDTDDYCGLVTTFTLDEATARAWRQAIDQKKFQLTVWYRLKSVAKKEWSRHPHYTDGRLAHQIFFDVEVVAFQPSTAK